MRISPRAISVDGATLAINLAYPFLVYGALRYLSPALLAIGFSGFLLLRLALAGLKQAGPIGAAEIWLVGIAGASALSWALISPIAGLTLYPIFVSLGFGAIFGYSILAPPTIVERIARLRETEVPAHALIYFRRVTLAWVAFFVVNGTLSALTALSGNLELWTLYNGLISYLLIGAMFAGEFVIRRRVRGRLDRLT